ncbi:hypothetical protein D3C86_2094020 [compost metagenome]
MQAQLTIANEAKAERWFGVFQEPRKAERDHDFDHQHFQEMLMKMKPLNQEAFNDEKFALAA